MWRQIAILKGRSNILKQKRHRVHQDRQNGFLETDLTDSPSKKPKLNNGTVMLIFKKNILQCRTNVRMIYIDCIRFL